MDFRKGFLCYGFNFEELLILKTEIMGQAKFEIEKSSNDKFYFNLKAGNGEVILTSQMYGGKQSCENGISSCLLYTSPSPRDS